jgi:hypothetical protein
MRKSWLLCALLSGAMAWSQAQPGGTTAPPPTPPPGTPGAEQAPNAKEAEAPKPPAEVAEDAAVITIVGVCPPSTTASKTAAGKTAMASSAKKASECKTVITRREFEKIASGLSPNVTPQLKRQLSSVLPRFMAMSEIAKKQGLEKTEAYQETLKFAKMQILTTELQRSTQERSEKISDADIDKYYKENPEAYEQFSLDRLFIPRNKQVEPEKVEDEEKLTDEQRKAKDEADKAKQEQGQQELDKLADSLRERAAKGEDFTQLQKEAYEAAGMKMDAPTVNLPKVRRTGLPPAHAAVFNLKVGEVSQVISDNGGHYIYKVVSKEELPLDQVSQEIRNTLKNQNMKDTMEKYTSSYHVETNEAYFGPPTPQGPMGRPGMAPPPRPRPRIMPAQPQSAPPATNPPAQPPAQQPPPSN